MGSEEGTAAAIKRHFDVMAYQKAHDAAMQIFAISKQFPKEETYSLTDQVRRSSRSVCANFAEAWRKRMYPSAFVSKLTDCEAEAAETQTWLQLAVECGYVDRDAAKDLFGAYEEVLSLLVAMRRNPEKWLLPKPLSK